MTCGGAHGALRGRKGDAILAYCIAACKNSVAESRGTCLIDTTNFAPLPDAIWTDKPLFYLTES